MDVVACDRHRVISEPIPKAPAEAQFIPTPISMKNNKRHGMSAMYCSVRYEEHVFRIRVASSTILGVPTAFFNTMKACTEAIKSPSVPAVRPSQTSGDGMRNGILS